MTPIARRPGTVYTDSAYTPNNEILMSQRMIIGLCILVIGVILLVFGYNQTQSLSGEVGEALTGSYSNETMAYLIVGAIAVVAGLGITFTGGKR